MLTRRLNINLNINKFKASNDELTMGCKPIKRLHGTHTCLLQSNTRIFKKGIVNHVSLYVTCHVSLYGICHIFLARFARTIFDTHINKMPCATRHKHKFTALQVAHLLTTKIFNSLIFMK